MNVGYECSSYFKFCVHLKFFIIKISGRTEILISLHLLFFFSFPPNSLPNLSHLWDACLSSPVGSLFIITYLQCPYKGSGSRRSGARPRVWERLPSHSLYDHGPLTLNSAAHFPGPIGLVWGGKNNGRGMCKWLEEGLEYWEPSTGFSHD